MQRGKEKEVKKIRTQVCGSSCYHTIMPSALNESVWEKGKETHPAIFKNVIFIFWIFLNLR